MVQLLRNMKMTLSSKSNGPTLDNDGRTQEEADIASMNWKINIEEIQMPDR